MYVKSRGTRLHCCQCRRASTEAVLATGAPLQLFNELPKYCKSFDKGVQVENEIGQLQTDKEKELVNPEIGRRKPSNFVESGGRRNPE